MRSSPLSKLTPFLLLVFSSLAACSNGQIGARVGDNLVVKSRYGKAWALSTNPTEIGTLSSGFGYRRHPITGLNKPHRGIDLAAPKGTPVIAAADGVVLFQGDRGTYGNLSKIKHGRDVVTAYAHLDRFELGLVPGMSVQRGQIIGYVVPVDARAARICIMKSSCTANGLILWAEMKRNSRIIATMT